MRVWVFMQHSKGGMRADVFRTEAAAWQAMDTVVRHHWPKDIPMPDNKEVARRRFQRVRSDITLMLQGSEVWD